MSYQLVRDASPVRECAGGCGLCAEPGDIYCEGCRDAVPDRRADREEADRFGERRRCPNHPAFEPDYCPACGTAAQIRTDL